MVTHENGPPWNDVDGACELYHQALNPNPVVHFQCVKYLVDTGCPIDSFALELAMPNIEILELLRENGAPWKEVSDTSYKLYFTPIDEDMVNVIKWLFDKGCPFDADQFKEYTDKLYGTEEWYQKCILHIGIVDENNLHIHQKVKRIQSKWLEYAYNPSNTIGYSRMMKTVNQLEMLTAC